jgi:hypothetical protein
MHHILFPPRLQLVALQQNSDCLPAHLGNQLPFDGLFGDQPDGPSGTAFWRFAADHGNNTLLLGAVENLLCPRPMFGVDGGIQAVAHVAMGDLADRFRSKGESLSDLRCGETARKPAERKRSHDDANLLNASAQDLADLHEVRRLNFDRNGAPRHTTSMPHITVVRL